MHFIKTHFDTFFLLVQQGTEASLERAADVADLIRAAGLPTAAALRQPDREVRVCYH